MNVKVILTEYLVDIVLGLYTYTYPRHGEKELKAYIPRPWGFRVYEIINNVSLENLTPDAIAKLDTSICSEGYIYVVEKVNLESHILCDILKKVLRCSSCEMLGLKDKKAVVRQIVILRNCSNIVKNIESSYEDGYLKAIFWQCNPSIIHSYNKFLVDIVIKKGDANIVRDRLNVMKSHDFVFLNFFGYQRFGTLRPITHVLGKFLVKKEWNSFLDVLCKSNVKSKSQALEHSICSLIPKYGADLEVVKRIPKTYLVFYVNAYQSYIFNVVLSKLWLKIIEDQGFEKAFEVLKDKYKYIPLVGSKTYVSQNDVKEIIEEVLEIEGTQLEDFNIKPLGIDIKGGTRRTFEKAYDVVAQFTNNKVTLSFVLNRGCYATIFIRELLKIDPVMYV